MKHRLNTDKKSEYQTVKAKRKTAGNRMRPAQYYRLLSSLSYLCSICISSVAQFSPCSIRGSFLAGSTLGRADAELGAGAGDGLGLLGLFVIGGGPAGL